jgi:hypothetical protein
LPANCAARGLKNTFRTSVTSHDPSVQHAPSPIAAFTGSISFDTAVAGAGALVVVAAADIGATVVPAVGPEPSAAVATEIIADTVRPRISFFISAGDGLL